MGLAIFFQHPREGWDAAYEAAEGVLGELTVEFEPHVTLLYLGDVRQGVKLDVVREAIGKAIDGVKAIPMKGKGVSWFEPSGNPGGRTPILISYELDDTLDELAVRMLRALAPYVHATQFLDYAPHATLGYYEGILSTSQRLAISNLSDGVDEWTGRELVLSDGGEVLGRFVLTGVSKSEADSHVLDAVSDNDADVSWGCTFVAKSSDDEQIVTGIVLEPDEVDLQNDTVSAGEIKLASRRFLARYGKMTQLGLMHEMFGDIGVELVESWIAREDSIMNGAPVKKGSWLMSVHVTSKALWASVKDGSITGFSIGGTAKVTETPFPARS